MLFRGYYSKIKKSWNKGKKDVYSEDTKLKMSNPMKSIKKSKGIPINNNLNILCDYGCGEKANFQLKNNKYCCCETFRSCNKIKKDKSIIISKIWKDQTTKYFLKEYFEKRSNIMKLKWSNPEHPFNSIERKNKMREMMLNGGVEYANSFPCKGFKNHKEWMMNGGAAHMNKFIKNPSKPEVMLRDMVKQLYPNCEPQYKVFNYSIDVVLVENKIAIEYDGWHHFNCQESIDYHNFRQKRIENEG